MCEQACEYVSPGAAGTVRAVGGGERKRLYRRGDGGWQRGRGRMGARDMAWSAGVKRIVVWSVAVLCGVVSVGLVVLVAVRDLDTGDRTASIVGAVAGLAGLAVSVYFGLRQQAGAKTVVRATGPGATAVRGRVTGNAFGARSKVTSSPGGAIGTTAPGDGEVSARGSGAFAADGEVSANAFGDDSEVDGR